MMTGGLAGNAEKEVLGSGWYTWNDQVDSTLKMTTEDSTAKVVYKTNHDKSLHQMITY